MARDETAREHDSGRSRDPRSRRPLAGATGAAVAGAGGTTPAETFDSRTTASPTVETRRDSAGDGETVEHERIEATTDGDRSFGGTASVGRDGLPLVEVRDGSQ